ncbi:Protein of unknown function [Weissella confusa LBAE C39-2]|nr:Protein of unknown function [Weissella confusa LBAE C39-2]
MPKASNDLLLAFLL